MGKKIAIALAALGTAWLVRREMPAIRREVNILRM